mmetsp:Transcript_33326/g.72774  ORF Transcript_33326/g.72774 Transcript_33326/m.72774 type:complete len:307 (+) Transcript_33326:106-1026(+)|eukprot:CAMPEP_0170583090 /NCGR_PEP_ID=MMETSP0224-20130122/7942_1 /TAXON_ID=285029 /ORGANISM="Togula jolla, Strain CCCM 725" /LENGTH=306 /DNA_ID=CAMNT_0010906379 /DNA_START=26 /DNA_END=946 /DNA_ORIENTATION=-
MQPLLVLKAVLAAVLALLGVGGGLLPIYLSTNGVRREITVLTNAFAGGVLLAAALVHMLPDASESLVELGFWIQRSFVPSAEEPFPIAPVVAGIAYFLLSLLEVTLEDRLHREQVDHHLLEANDKHRPLTGHEPRRNQSRDVMMCRSETNTAASVAVIVASPQCVSARALVLALAVHSLIEGIGIGAQPSLANTLAVFVAVGAHKGLAGFALGSKLNRSCGPTEVKRSVIVFGACTPVGMVIGALLENNIAGTQVGFLLALTAGTFLKIAIPELILPAFEAAQHRKTVVLLCLLGFVAMAFLAIWA